MSMDMRRLLDLMEANIDYDSAPDTYEAGDAAHYDALHNTGFFGSQAAGAIIMAKTTGRIMLVLRSSAVLQPHTWANVGGAHHSDELPVDAARREAYEETGYRGQIEMIPLLVFQKDSFRYCNYLAIVEDEFIPNLGWEADDYQWCNFGDWPSPLHFGLVSLFGDTASVKVIRHYADMFSAE